VVGGMSLQQARFDHIGRDLAIANQAFQREALELLKKEGHDWLTPSLLNVLPHLDMHGTPMASLVSRLPMTAQAVGQLVNELVKLGILKKEADSLDRRAITVQFTPAGTALMQDAIAVKSKIERRYANVLGAEEFKTLRTLLGRLSAQ